MELGFHGDHACFQCVAIVDEERQRFVFLARYPVRVPRDRREAVLEWVSRANCGLAVGNFEMDPEDGNVPVRTSVDVEGLGLPGVLGRDVIAPAVG